MTPLKPCPFCGGPAKLSGDDYSDLGGFDTVQCQNRECEARITTSYSNNVRHKWNTRDGIREEPTRPHTTSEIVECGASYTPTQGPYKRLVLQCSLNEDHLGDHRSSTKKANIYWGSPQ